MNQVAERLAELSGISEVFSVSGNYDLVAIVRVRSNDDLTALVTEHIHQFDDTIDTETMLAFKAYSRHDLESLFSVGIE